MQVEQPTKGYALYVNALGRPDLSWQPTILDMASWGISWPQLRSAAWEMASINALLRRPSEAKAQAVLVRFLGSLQVGTFLEIWKESQSA